LAIRITPSVRKLSFRSSAIELRPLSRDRGQQLIGVGDHVGHGFEIGRADPLGELVAGPLIVEKHQTVVLLGKGGKVLALVGVLDIDERLQASELSGRSAIRVTMRTTGAAGCWYSSWGSSTGTRP
jgi:hypothetical protein